MKIIDLQNRVSRISEHRSNIFRSNRSYLKFLLLLHLLRLMHLKKTDIQNETKTNKQTIKTIKDSNLSIFYSNCSDGLAHSTRRLIESHRLDLLRNITDLLGRTFSSQFVFPVLGHEDGQGNSFRRLGELWRHWLPSEALQTFEKGKSFVYVCCVYGLL